MRHTAGETHARTRRPEFDAGTRLQANQYVPASAQTRAGESSRLPPQGQSGRQGQGLGQSQRQQMRHTAGETHARTRRPEFDAGAWLQANQYVPASAQTRAGESSRLPPQGQSGRQGQGLGQSQRQQMRHTAGETHARTRRPEFDAGTRLQANQYVPASAQTRAGESSRLPPQGQSGRQGQGLGQSQRQQMRHTAGETHARTRRPEFDAGAWLQANQYVSASAQASAGENSRLPPQGQPGRQGQGLGQSQRQQMRHTAG